MSGCVSSARMPAEVAKHDRRLFEPAATNLRACRRTRSRTLGRVRSPRVRRGRSWPKTRSITDVSGMLRVRYSEKSWSLALIALSPYPSRAHLSTSSARCRLGTPWGGAALNWRASFPPTVLAA